VNYYTCWSSNVDHAQHWNPVSLSLSENINPTAWSVVPAYDYLRTSKDLL
jgi:hypothetical protein